MNGLQLFPSAVTCYLENILYFYLPCTLRPLNCDTVDMRKVFDVYHVDQLHVLQNDILRLPVFKRFVVNTSQQIFEPANTLIFVNVLTFTNTYLLNRIQEMGTQRHHLCTLFLLQQQLLLPFFHKDTVTSQSFLCLYFVYPFHEVLSLVFYPCRLLVMIPYWMTASQGTYRVALAWQAGTSPQLEYMFFHALLFPMFLMSKGNVSLLATTSISHILRNEVQDHLEKNYVLMNIMRGHFQGLNNGVYSVFVSASRHTVFFCD